MNRFAAINPYATIARLEKELAVAREYQALAEKVMDLNQRMVHTMDQQQAELEKAQVNLVRLLADLEGWKARSELAEKSLKEVLHELIEKPFARFPDLSNN